MPSRLSAFAAVAVAIAIAPPAYAQDASPDAAPAPAAPATAVTSEVSIVGDFRYETNFRNNDPALDRLREEETELAVTGYLSPWSRADFFLSHHDQALELEEGFLTLSELPYDLKARVGKFKMPFGKLNPVHPEGWLFVDAPLAMVNLLGSDEGWNDYAVELSGFIPMDLLTTFTVTASNGDGATTLQRGPMASGRLTTYLPFTDESGLELGVSGASQAGVPVAGLDRRSLVGADARYRWRPNAITSFTVLGEAMALAEGAGTPWGAYLTADYQFLTNHDVDLRLDRSDVLDPQGAATGVGTAASITYDLGLFETTRFKLQYSHTFTPATEERVIAQTVFVLGPHKHALNF